MFYIVFLPLFFLLSLVIIGGLQLQGLGVVSQAQS